MNAFILIPVLLAAPTTPPPPSIAEADLGAIDYEGSTPEYSYFEEIEEPRTREYDPLQEYEGNEYEDEELEEFNTVGFESDEEGVERTEGEGRTVGGEAYQRNQLLVRERGEIEPDITDFNVSHEPPDDDEQTIPTTDIDSPNDFDVTDDEWKYDDSYDYYTYDWYWDKTAFDDFN